MARCGLLAETIMNKLHFSQADQKDIQSIASLHAQSWRENYKGCVADDYLEKRVDAERLTIWTERLTNPRENQWILLVKSNEALVGFICLYQDNHAEYGTLIDNLHVDSNFKGQGIGTKLMKKAVEWVMQNNSNSAIYLEVLSKNSAAIGFYKSLGGKELAKTVWSAPCGSQVDELIFEWTTPKVLLNYIELK